MCHGMLFGDSLTQTPPSAIYMVSEGTERTSKDPKPGASSLPKPRSVTAENETTVELPLSHLKQI